VLSGQHYFSSRKPKDFGRVETPTVTAAIKGTEFSVSVDADGATTITMLEGVVEASNEFGAVRIAAGEQAVARRGAAPVRSVVVRPRDAVAWAFYYPPVLGGADAARLRQMGESGAGLERAAQLLSVGQVSEATGLIESARAKDPRNPIAIALASVVALAGDRRDEARTLAEEALGADENSPAAALAASFSAQADFDIDKAAELAERAARLDPEDPAALARAAELRMARGDVAGARRAAEDALQRARTTRGPCPCSDSSSSRPCAPRRPRASSSAPCRPTPASRSPGWGSVWRGSASEISQRVASSCRPPPLSTRRTRL